MLLPLSVSKAMVMACRPLQPPFGRLESPGSLLQPQEPVTVPYYLGALQKLAQVTPSDRRDICINQRHNQLAGILLTQANQLNTLATMQAMQRASSGQPSHRLMSLIDRATEGARHTLEQIEQSPYRFFEASPVVRASRALATSVMWAEGRLNPIEDNAPATLSWLT
ncbi:MAG: hypothetical protein KC474_05555 [Cyanobacteria bacterium HKST-UBA04]|nr:hypothetical protein [Cyanobacteria bacterium HKST-UBA04]